MMTNTEKQGRFREKGQTRAFTVIETVRAGGCIYSVENFLGMTQLLKQMSSVVVQPDAAFHRRLGQTFRNICRKRVDDQDL